MIGARTLRFVLFTLWWLSVAGTPALFSFQNKHAVAPAKSPALEVGPPGGRLLFGQRSEPRTLNPLNANDASSKQILGLLNGDLLHINRSSFDVEPALASSFTVSADGREYTLTLRSGLRFSDGQPCTIEDIVFSFRVYEDEHLQANQRDLLMVGGKAMEVRQVSADSVRFRLATPYAAAERLFDSVFILPKHLLQKAYDAGTLGQNWPLTVRPDQIAGLGPFRLKEYVPGQRLVLERNPYYWKRDASGKQLPYLNEVTSIALGSAQAEAMRFANAETDLADRLSPADFQAMGPSAKARRLHLADLGPGLDFQMLVFNLNGDKRDPLMQNLAFRRAVSVAMDRNALVRIAFQGKAYALSSFVPPGDYRWVNAEIPHWRYSTAEAHRILQEAGFSWSKGGRLRGPGNKDVAFSIVYNSGNPQHGQMATLIQQDLTAVGIEVNVVALEFHSLLDRVFRTHDYQAAIMTLAGSDADPNSEINIWSSSGSLHVWNFTDEKKPAPWQAEIDGLMHRQMMEPDYRQRKAMYDRVQQLVWSNLPVIPLISPNLLVGAKDQVGNFRPAILADHILWDAEHLFIRQGEQPYTQPPR